MNNALQRIYSTGKPNAGLAHVFYGDAKRWYSTYRANVAGLPAYIGGDALYG